MIVAMAGDGIGRQVLPEALRVLEASGWRFRVEEAAIGWEEWRQRAEPLPPRTLALLREHRLGLLGAITSRPAPEAEAALVPELRGKGHLYSSPIVRMRQELDLEICLRPCRSLPGNPLNFVRRRRDGALEEPEIDVVVFRQNTEGLYAGVEWTDPPEPVRRALESHPRFAPFREIPGSDLAVSTRIFTRGACRRILRAAFGYAEDFGYATVTVCEKPNVLRQTSGMMVTEAREVARDHPGIRLETTNVDAQTMWLTRNPESLGVVVAGNMFGDILSDACAGLTGGLGFAASANLGPGAAVFEPTHGSAPRYQELAPAIVNPVAMILSACLLLDHVGETERATAVRGAIARVVARGETRTYDMLGLRGGPQVLDQGAASTREMTDAIVQEMERGSRGR